MVDTIMRHIEYRLSSVFSIGLRFFFLPFKNFNISESHTTSFESLRKLSINCSIPE